MNAAVAAFLGLCFINAVLNLAILIELRRGKRTRHTSEFPRSPRASAKKFGRPPKSPDAPAALRSPEW